MSQKKQRAKLAAAKAMFIDHCERHGLPTTRCEDVWIAPYYARQQRRAFAAAKKNLAAALIEQKIIANEGI